MILNAIKQMETYARYNPHVVSLSQGIPYQLSDNKIRDEVIEALKYQDIDTYSDPKGILQLRREISEMLMEEKMVYSQDEIIVTAGATEGLMATFLSLLNSKRNEVIIPTPSYSAYYRIVEAARGKTIFLPLNEQNDWELDILCLSKKITKKTAAILLCNPNNPTGYLYSKKVLIDICMIAKENNMKVILDEVYGNMLYDSNTCYTPCMIDELKDTIIRVVSFSKDFSLSGWRVAFLHSDKRTIEKILPFHDITVNCAPVISQYAALAAIHNKDRIINRNKIIYSYHRALMQSYLDDLSSYLAYQIPQGSYFFFPKFLRQQNVQEFCIKLLKEGNVAVVPGSDFGIGGENHIRLCFGRSKEDIIKGMERLTNFLVKSN